MPRYQEIPVDNNFPEMEREVLAGWEDAQTFETSVARRAGAPVFVFDDGPPFATGLPHYGHILTSYVKDVVPRFFTMRGYRVPRRWGWDCHGLPVELEAEKELGISSRSDILSLGIDAFNDTCRSMVLKYASEWRTIISRLGRWVDFDRAYKTMDFTYMESVIWCFKRLHEQGLVYERNKVVPYCIRCQTPLSNFEARLDDAYRPRQDASVVVRFPLLDTEQESLLAWTTTPWTLPSNTVLAVGADIEYVRLTNGTDSVWLAANAVDRFPQAVAGYTEAERRPGQAFVGRRYRPPFDEFASTIAAQVLAADFVSTEDGTGVVHVAPSFGEDDEALCTEAGFVGPNPVRDDGTFDPSIGDLAGVNVFEANDRIIRTLKARGLLWHRATYDHNYPHCWRCDTPLIYRAIPSWFVKVTAFKQQLLDANAKIRWIPGHIRDGRFGNWLENARDWAVSRSRFWGAPVPVWRCASCDAIEVLGSVDEMAARSGHRPTDLHRPAIDDVTMPCPCGDTMRRVPDVLDCWFESGAMPYGQVHYPFEDKTAFEQQFPADFIVEYVAQTRGWFYTLVVLAAALMNRPPFRTSVCHGVILASDGRKMSKRLKNYPDPMVLTETHGSDALRVALLSSPAMSGVDMRFDEELVRDAVRRFCIPLWNSLHYFTAYARIDRFHATGDLGQCGPLDRYLLHEADVLRARLEAAMDDYDFAAAYRHIEEFILTLSTWYIRLTRALLWGEGIDDRKRGAYEALHASFDVLTRVIAPFLPFLAERMYAVLGQSESVHLADWPHGRPEWRVPRIAEEMTALRTIVKLGRNVRERHRIKHRHPLRQLSVAGLPAATVRHYETLLRTELNVKAVEPLDNPDAFIEKQVKLDGQQLGRRLRGDFPRLQQRVREGRFEIAPTGELVADDLVAASSEYELSFVPRGADSGIGAEGHLVVLFDLERDEALIEEGHVRDLNRRLQDLRKTAGLAYAERIVVSVVAPPPVQELVARSDGWLAEQVLATKIQYAALPQPLASAEVTIAGTPVTLALAKDPERP